MKPYENERFQNLGVAIRNLLCYNEGVDIEVIR